MAIIGLVLGIVSLIGALLGGAFWAWAIVAIVGIVLSAIGMKTKKGAGIAGLVLSIIALVLTCTVGCMCTCQPLDLVCGAAAVGSFF